MDELDCVAFSRRRLLAAGVAAGEGAEETLGAGSTTTGTGAGVDAAAVAAVLVSALSVDTTLVIGVRLAPLNTNDSGCTDVAV